MRFAMKLQILTLVFTFLAGLFIGQRFSNLVQVRAQVNPRVYVYHVTTEFSSSVKGEPIGFSCVPTATGQALCHVLSVER